MTADPEQPAVPDPEPASAADGPSAGPDSEAPAVTASAFPRRRAILAALVALALLVLALQPRPPLDNSATAWLPGRNPRKASYHHFLKDFGSDDVIIVHLRGGSDQARLEKVVALTEELLDDAAVERIISAATVFEDSVDLLLDELLGGFTPANLKTAGRAFRGPLGAALRLYDTDRAGQRDEATLYVLIKPGKPHERERLARRLAELRPSDKAGITALVAGQPLTNLELDRASREVETRGMPALIALCVITLLLVTRSPRLTIALFIPVGLAVPATEGLLTVFGLSGNLLVVTVKPLLFVLLLAGGLHIVVAFQSLRAVGVERTRAALDAVRAKGGACLLAMLTTAVGFGSLAISDVMPISRFGWLTAAGLALGALVVIFVLPAALALIGGPPRSPETGFAGHTASRLVALGRARPRLWIFAGIVIAVTGGAAALNLPVESDALTYFPKTNALRADAEALLARQLPLSSVELILTFKESPFQRREPLRQLDNLSRRLAELRGVRACLDPCLALRDQNARGRTGRPELPDVFFVRDAVPELAERGLVADEGRRVRFSLLCGTLDPERLDNLDAAIEGAVSEAFEGAPPRVELTGIDGLLVSTQSALLQTLASSLLTTALLMELILIVALRSLRLGLIALLPNAFPVCVNFLLMTAVGIPLDVGTTMTAAIALGIAIDDTLHFLAAAKAGGLAETAHNTGRALVLSTCVITAGFLTLVPSDFSPTSAFGLLCATAMVTALLGDLLILPALLDRYGDLEDRPASSR